MVEDPPMQPDQDLDDSPCELEKLSGDLAGVPGARSMIYVLSMGWNETLEPRCRTTEQQATLKLLLSVGPHTTRQTCINVGLHKLRISLDATLLIPVVHTAMMRKIAHRIMTTQCFGTILSNVQAATFGKTMNTLDLKAGLRNEINPVIQVSSNAKGNTC